MTAATAFVFGLWVGVLLGVCCLAVLALAEERP